MNNSAIGKESDMKKSFSLRHIAFTLMLSLAVFCLASCETKITHSHAGSARQNAFLDTLRKGLQCDAVTLSRNLGSGGQSSDIELELKNSKVLASMDKDSVAKVLETVVHQIISRATKEDVYTSFTITVISASNYLIASSTSSVTYSYDAYKLRAIHEMYFPSQADNSELTEIVNKINVLIDEKKYQEILVIADSMIERDHNNIYPLMFKAIAAHKLHDIPTAIANLELARRIDSTDTQVISMLGMVYYEKGNYPQATELLDRVLKNAPDNGRALYYRGLLYKEFQQKSYGDSLIRMAADVGYDEALQALKSHASSIRKK